MKAHLLVFVVVGLAFGQDGKTSSSVGNASVVKTESAEHKFAVKKLAEATAAFNEIVQTLDALKGKGAYRAEDTLLNRMGVAEREVYDAKQRVARADECVQVYAVTIDKKTSDLTQREVDAVGGCKSLSLYPPPKASTTVLPNKP